MIDFIPMQCICAADQDLDWEPAGIGKTLEDAFIYKCRQADCGLVFRIGNNVVHKLQDENTREYNIFKIRHWLAKQLPSIFLNNQDGKETVSRKMWIPENVLDEDLPSLMEQVNNLIRMLATSNNPYEIRNLEYQNDGVYVGSCSMAVYKEVCMHVLNKKLISLQHYLEQPKNPEQSENFHLTGAILTVEGSQYYQELTAGKSDHRQGFMAMAYKNKTLTRIVREHFIPAAKAAGFKLIRLDDINQAGLIDDQMLVEIQKSDFIVADLSDENFGAYFEAGYAMGLKKPVLFTCEQSVFESKETELHFDVNHYRMILWDKANPKEAANKLKDAIRATLPEKAKMDDT